MLGFQAAGAAPIVRRRIIRKPETIATAITAAETGHLVFATLHTNSAPQTVHRIVDAFGEDAVHEMFTPHRAFRQ